jgi:hypothetical protein
MLLIHEAEQRPRQGQQEVVAVSAASAASLYSGQLPGGETDELLLSLSWDSQAEAQHQRDMQKREKKSASDEALISDALGPIRQLLRHGLT